MVAETIVETDLYAEADEMSASQGRLPEGSLLRLLGKRQSGFENVEVELVDRIAEGWVRRKALNLKAQEEQNEKWELRPKSRRQRPEAAEGRRDNSGRRLLVPKDEILLIRRAPSFFYGVVVEMPLAYIDDAAGNFFTGINYRVGAHIGFYLTQTMPLRFEVAYARMGGVSDSVSPIGAGKDLSIGFADIRSQLEIQFGDFMALGFIQYSIGTGVGAAPSGITFGSAGSLSSLWVGAGGGYRLGFGDFNSLLLQSTYSMSLLKDPLGFQSIGFRVLWEVRG